MEDETVVKTQNHRELPVFPESLEGAQVKLEVRR